MNLTTKGDLVLAALRKLGVASNATLTDVEPQSMEDGVNDLEMMMAEWLGGDASHPKKSSTAADIFAHSLALPNVLM